jgi:hypothetical protein
LPKALRDRAEAATSRPPLGSIEAAAFAGAPERAVVEPARLRSRGKKRRVSRLIKAFKGYRARDEEDAS